LVIHLFGVGRLATGVWFFVAAYLVDHVCSSTVQPVESVSFGWMDSGLVNKVVTVDDLKCFEFEYDYSLEIFLYRKSVKAEFRA
jgi:hypothetical protein